MVAPGIAEALLATALGLVAAIPAVVIYNLFARRSPPTGRCSAMPRRRSMRLVSRDLDRRRASAPRRRRASAPRLSSGRWPAASRPRRATISRRIHEINVTPFIDVMLVLLIIFMVAAPLATVDVAVDLPASTRRAAAAPGQAALPDREERPVARARQRAGGRARRLARALDGTTEGDKRRADFPARRQDRAPMAS